MKRLTSDVAFTATSQIAAMLAVIGIQIVLARSTTPAVFGQVALAQAMVALVEAALVARGAEVAIQILGQNWSKGGARLKAIVRHLMRYDILITTAGYFAFAGAALVLAPAFGANGLYIAALGLAVVFQIGYGMRRSLFLLNNQVRRQAIFETVQSCLMLGVTAPLIWLFGEWGLVAGTLASAAIKNLGVHLQTADLWREAKHAPVIDIGDQIARPIRISSVHSVLRNLLTNGAANADILILGLLGRPEVVAAYRVAKTLSSMPIRIAGPMWVVLRPRLLAALLADDHRRYCLIVGKAAALFAVASVVSIVAAWAIGRPVLLHFYGTAYEAALYPLLVLMIGSSIFGAITGWLSFTMIITSRKSLGTAIFAAQLVLVCGAGFLIGGTSAVAMAWVVTGCNIAISALAWWALLDGRFRHVQVASE